MNGIVTLRDNLRRFYAEYGEYMKPFFRFLLALSSLYLLKNHLGFSGGLIERPIFIVSLSFLCVFFNTGCVSFVCAVYLIAGMFQVSYAACLFTGLYFMLILMLYFGLRPGKGFIIILVPLSFILHVPYIVPVILGLTGMITSLIPCCFGLGVWFILRYFTANAETLTRTTDIKLIAEEFLGFLRGTALDKEFYVFLTAFVLCIIIICIVRKMSFNYSWTVSIFLGILCMAAVLFAGSSIFEFELDLLVSILGFLAAFAAGLIYKFFFFHVDYKTTEHLQFEDDDYYYYVKAVPKVTSSDDTERRE